MFGFYEGNTLQLHCNALWDWFKPFTDISDMCVVECGFNTMHYGIALNYPDKVDIAMHYGILKTKSQSYKLVFDVGFRPATLQCVQILV